MSVLLTPAQRAQLERLHVHNRALRRDPVRGPAWEAALRAGQVARYGPPPVTLEELLQRYVEKEPRTGCWIWRGPRNPLGYGRLTRPFGQHRPFSRAHRVVYEATGYVLPSDADLHHVCRVRQCVNPDHLEPLTRSDHLRLEWDRRRGRRPYYEGLFDEDEAGAPAPSSDRVPEELADLVCLCGRTPGVFAAACCEGLMPEPVAPA
jgi:HNH endonuclease